MFGFPMARSVDLGDAAPGLIEIGNRCDRLDARRVLHRDSAEAQLVIGQACFAAVQQGELVHAEFGGAEPIALR